MFGEPCSVLFQLDNRSPLRIYGHQDKLSKGESIMKHMTGILMGLLVATVMLAFSTGAVMAQEKAKAEKAKMAPAAEKMKGAPTVKALLENERVRVNDVRFKPGDKSKMEERPDRVVYVIKGGEYKRHYPDGKTENVKLKAGEATFIKKDTSALENVGKTETHFIGTQLK